MAVYVSGGVSSGFPFQVKIVNGLTRWYWLPNFGATGTNTGLGINVARLCPFWIPNACTLLAIGAEVTVAGDAGSLVHMGIYNDDGTGRPGILLADIGSLNGASATVQSIGSLNIPLPAGMYHYCQILQNITTTQPTMRVQAASFILPTDNTAMPGVATNNGGWVNAGPWPGALPNSFPGVTGSQANSVPRMFAQLT